MYMCVVGSGPAGVSVSLALLKRGYNVTMLDYGNDLSAERSADIDTLSNTPKNAWTNELTNRIKYTVRADIENKLVYGEDFPYRDSLNLLNVTLQNCKHYPSLAVGGLSNAWGGAVLPYINRDIQDWPITIEDLEPYYKEIASLINISTFHDDKDELIKDYPLYSNRRNEKRLNGHHISSQIQQLYQQLRNIDKYNKKHNVRVGYARNAYDADLCIDCALCMWGCPLNLIYNSKHTLNNTLKLNPQFTYISNVLVKTFRETNSAVQIVVSDKNTKQEREYTADKLFLASGVLSTAKIVLQSLKNYSPVYMADTPYFIAPLINFKLKGEYVNNQNYNTLSQLFIEINNDLISKNTIHLQLYPYNDMMLNLFQNKFGKFFSIMRPILQAIFNKTVVVQGFFHSNEGTKIKVQLQQDGSLLVTGKNHKVKLQVKKILTILKKNGVIPIYELGASGRSFHSGGTFPMTNNSSKETITTNTLGLINQTQNVHIVDASIFPSIPAQTIAYTVMANAYRIGSQV
jgi:choline dehydrogenase-like flavoprotein